MKPIGAVLLSSFSWALNVFLCIQSPAGKRGAAPELPVRAAGEGWVLKGDLGAAWEAPHPGWGSAASRGDSCVHVLSIPGPALSGEGFPSLHLTEYQCLLLKGTVKFPFPLFFFLLFPMVEQLACLYFRPEFGEIMNVIMQLKNNPYNCGNLYVPTENPAAVIKASAAFQLF